MTGRALITGVAGQDGAYLARRLLADGVHVVGTHRPGGALWRLEELGLLGEERLKLIALGPLNQDLACSLIDGTEPDLVFNLAAQSLVNASFDRPLETAEVTGLGALHLLEAIRVVNPAIRFYQASSSELYGEAPGAPQSESTPFHPRSPYATSKLFAHWMTVNYRQAHGLFAASGILFNHESPLRGLEFVTRKITNAVAKIRLGLEETLEIGNLSAERDWGYAADYVDGMVRMLAHPTPDTFVLATGQGHTVRQFVELAFRAAEIELEWGGEGCDEVGVERGGDHVRVRVDPRFYRPAETVPLRGDPSRARDELGWRPDTRFEQLVPMMVQADLQRNRSRVPA